MTRYTNFARKRTYEQATLNYRDNDVAHATTPDGQESTSEKRESKRSRKDTPQSKDIQLSEGKVPQPAADVNAEASGGSQMGNTVPSGDSQPIKPARKKTHRAGKRVKGE